MYPWLDVDFKLCNILKCKFNDAFDIVYAKEFISHVHPISKFVEAAQKIIRDGGYLIISDTNPLNPLSSYRAWKEHRRGLYKYVKDPETGEYVPYAIERLVSRTFLGKSFQITAFKQYA